MLRAPAWPYFDEIVKATDPKLSGLLGLSGIPGGKVLFDAEHQQLLFPAG